MEHEVRKHLELLGKRAKDKVTGLEGPMEPPNYNYGPIARGEAGPAEKPCVNKI